MGKRSNFRRRPQDAYQTIDPKAVQALLPHLDGAVTFAEPCAGDGHMVRWLEAAGLRCFYRSDITYGVDALTLAPGDLSGIDLIITNPPWTRELLHPLILHLSKLRPTWLLFDSDWSCNRMAMPFLPTCSDIVPTARLKWIEDTPDSAKDNTSWYRFDAGHRGPTVFHGRR